MLVVEKVAVAVLLCASGALAGPLPRMIRDVEVKQLRREDAVASHLLASRVSTSEPLPIFSDDAFSTPDRRPFSTTGTGTVWANAKIKGCGLWNRCKSQARAQSDTLTAPLTPRQDISDLTNIPDTQGSGFDDPDLGGPPPETPSPQTHPKACDLWNWRSCSGWWFSKRSPPNTRSVVARQETSPSTSPPITSTDATTSDSNESPTSTNRDPKPSRRPSVPKAGLKNKAWDLWGRDDERALGKRDPGVTGPRTKKGAWSLWGNGNSKSRARGLNGVEVRQEGDDTEDGGWIDEPEVKEKGESLWRWKFGW